MTTKLEARIREIVARRTPHMWKVMERDDLVARSGAWGYTVVDPKYKKYKARIMVPPLTDTFALSVFLHEVGHIEHSHHTESCKEPEWRIEYDAEKFMMAALRAEGFRVTAEISTRARENVRKIVIAELNKRDHDDIDEEVLRFVFPDNWRDYK